MKRTVRLLAVPTLAMLILASCGTNSTDTEASPASSGEQTEATEEATDESDAWPVVEDEDGNVEENPEDQPVVAEFDGEEYELDLDALEDSKMPISATYYLEGMTGVTAMAEIGVDGPEQLEEMRQLVGAEPVTYIRIDVDNREGTDEISMYEWFMYDAEGKEYAFQGAASQALEWDEVLDDGSDADLAANDLAWEIESESANVGQRNVQWLIGPADLPDEVAVMSAKSSQFIDEFYPMPVR